MESLKKRGKPGRKKVKDKVRVVWIYLRNSEKKRIEDKYGRVQNAVMEVLLPQCG